MVLGTVVISSGWCNFWDHRCLGLAQLDVLDDFRKLPLLPGGLTVPVSVSPGLIKRIH